MAYRALYRKYRPRLFADIIGQPGLTQALRHQVASGRVSHAYLFSGPRGTGKTSAAKVLARAINCMDPQEGEACGCCRACTELALETNMDIIEIDAASNNSVDKVREMLDNVKYMPAVGRFRVYIVDEVHMLSTSAFNALLKTLEEPPAHVVFILATTEPHKLPATVLSRCQQFQFKRIGTVEMSKLLENVLRDEGATADKEAVAAIARASDGGMRDALSLLDQCLSLSGDHVTKQQVMELLGTADSAAYFEVSAAILGGDPGAAVDRLDAFIASGGDIKTFATDLTRHMRDLFIASYVKSPADILDVSAEEAGHFARQAARFAPGDMLRALGVLASLEGNLRYAANPRVLVELALFQCCRIEKENDYAALLTRVERLEAQLAGWQPQQAAAPAPQPEPIAAAPVQKPVERTAPPVESRRESAPIAQPETGWPQEPPAAQDVPPWDEPPLPAEPSVPTPEPVAKTFAQPVQNVRQEAAMEPKLPAEPAPTEPEPPRRAGAGPGETPMWLWKAIVEELGRQNAANLLAFATKGKGTVLEGDVLTVAFSQDDRAAGDMLGRERPLARIMQIAEGILGRPVQVKFDVSPWSPAEQRFIDRTRAVAPSGATIIIEKD